MTSAGPGSTAYIAALVEAFDRAQPGRVVCLSTIGAQVSHSNLLNQLGLVEEALGALDLSIGVES